MSGLLILPVAPVSYNIDGAAAATGLSTTTIKNAIRANDLTARFAGTKPLIGHADLLEWFNALPLDKPERNS